MCRRVQCEGKAQTGLRCHIRSDMEDKAALPLRVGEKFCMHHAPKGSLGALCVTQCKGIKPDGTQCRITTAFQDRHGDDPARPLRKGKGYCIYHIGQADQPAAPAVPVVRCAAMTALGQCQIDSSLYPVIANAKPLTDGRAYCFRHLLAASLTPSPPPPPSQPQSDGGATGGAVKVEKVVKVKGEAVAGKAVAVAAPAPAKAAKSLKRGREKAAEEDEKDEDALCCVCLEAKKDTALAHASHTSHMCVCYACAVKLKEAVAGCPICRAPIVDVFRVYL